MRNQPTTSEASSVTGVEALDLITIMEAAQAICDEIGLGVDRLLEKLLKLDNQVFLLNYQEVLN